MTDKLVELIAKYFEKLNPNSNHIIATRLAGYLRNNGVTFAEDNNVPDKNVVEWIPVSERLPELWGYYLCTAIKPERGGTYIRTRELVYYDISLKCWDCEDMIITHWMPLPEPPKEGE